MAPFASRRAVRGAAWLRSHRGCHGIVCLRVDSGRLPAVRVMRSPGCAPRFLGGSSVPAGDAGGLKVRRALAGQTLFASSTGTGMHSCGASSSPRWNGAHGHSSCPHGIRMQPAWRQLPQWQPAERWLPTAGRGRKLAITGTPPSSLRLLGAGPEPGLYLVQGQAPAHRGVKACRFHAIRCLNPVPAVVDGEGIAATGLDEPVAAPGSDTAKMVLADFLALIHAGKCTGK